MKVRVDRTLCQGHARCWSTAPDVYTLDDEGYCDIGELEVPAGLEADAREGAEACPEEAIEVLED